jgi:glycosyltransferase involved in cell wall biosynthesis
LNPVAQAQLDAFRDIKPLRAPKWLRVRNTAILAVVDALILARRLPRKTLVYCTYDLSTLQIASYLKTIRKDIQLVVRVAGLQWRDTISSDEEMCHVLKRYLRSVDALNVLYPGARGDLSDLPIVGPRVRGMEAIVGDVGVDPRCFDYHWQGSGNPEELRLVMVGRLTNRQKRQDLLIQMLSDVTETVGEIKVSLTLIGSGNNQDNLETQVRRLGLSDNVTFTPWLDSEPLWSELTRYDLMVHATDYEGVSKSLLEGMAIGMPILASDAPGVSTCFFEAASDSLVPNNVSDWTSTLLKIYEDKTRLASHGQRLRAIARREHDGDKKLGELLSRLEDRVQ